MQNLYALLTGAVVGILFTICRLPIPSPPTLTGILSIIGIYLGYVITNHFLK